MIIDKKDIEELDRYLEDFREFEAEHRHSLEQPSVAFFGERPHLLLPLGFDQSRLIPYPEESANFDDPTFETSGQRKYAGTLYGIRGIDFTFGEEWLYRRLSSGVWYWFNGLDNDRLLFNGPDADPSREVPVEELYAALRRLAKIPDSNPRTLWLPSIWTPRFQRDTSQFLANQVSTLLREIDKEGRNLREIRPRQLEELIAELLRDQGMEIHVTPATRDGGRDVIARGELIPGEPMVLAVEVKQKSVVGVEDLYKSLKANEDYPALLLATSGRFSAGVIKEKKRRRNELRLILKDGIALSQWIRMYGARRR